MSFKSLTVGSMRNGVLLFLRERRFKVALSQMQFGELVISSVAEGLPIPAWVGKLEINKSTWFELRGSESKHKTHRDRLGNQCSVLTPRLLAVGLRSPSS